MKDVAIGYISRVSILDYDSSLEIEVTPVINFARLETVMVVDLKEKKLESDK